MYLVPKYKVLVMFHLLKKVHFNNIIIKYINICKKIIEAIVEKTSVKKDITYMYVFVQCLEIYKHVQVTQKG